MASPSIVAQFDTIATNTNPFSLGASLTSVVPGDTIYLLVALDSTQTVVGASSTSMGIASFTRRSLPLNELNTSGSIPARLAAFAGIATLATSSPAITVATGGPYDDATAIAFVVRGCWPTAPFDSVSGLPFMTGGDPPSALSYITANNDDLLLFAFAGAAVPWQNPPPTVISDATFSWQDGVPNPGGFGFISIGVYAKSALTPQSSSINLTGGVGNSTVFLFDALTGSAAPSFTTGVFRPLLIDYAPYYALPNEIMLDTCFDQRLCRWRSRGILPRPQK